MSLATCCLIHNVRPVRVAVLVLGIRKLCRVMPGTDLEGRVCIDLWLSISSRIGLIRKQTLKRLDLGI